MIVDLPEPVAADEEHELARARPRRSRPGAPRRRSGIRLVTELEVDDGAGDGVPDDALAGRARDRCAAGHVALWQP